MDQTIRKSEVKDGLGLASKAADDDGGRSEQRVGHELEMRSLIRMAFFRAGLNGRLEAAVSRQSRRAECSAESERRERGDGRERTRCALARSRRVERQGRDATWSRPPPLEARRLSPQTRVPGSLPRSIAQGTCCHHQPALL